MMELRILYHGLGMAGKTTNLEKLKEIYGNYVYDRLHQQTSEGRTIYLDVLSLKLRTRLESVELMVSLFTTPGQKRYSILRPWLFGHISAVVFVFDSSRSVEENLESFQEIKDSNTIVVQANKRDAEGALPLEEIKRIFETYTVIPAVAKDGVGVVETFKEALRIALHGAGKVFRPS
ncbi:MAG: gliding motility protein [Hydrogenobacter thermophilus]|uniref:GTP-binding protein n=1 Tax=Hydrogenobacter thermophilus TaxID=940 RepID=UPI001C785D9B|nr:ADP-ribosylation factor-like protein [Hydrogenobacter thermophilus]QWK20185.1 MAG: gliding motility protein [Hydrogenobacter thermophilus]